MTIKFQEIDHAKKRGKTINLSASIQNKHSCLLIKVENDLLTVQADKYSEINEKVSEALNMIWEDIDIEYIKTWIIIESFLIIEVKIRED